MAPSVEGAGVALNVVEHGAGAPVLLIHGLAADAEAMAPVAQALAGEARVIAYDRRGYGSSGAPEPYLGTTVEEQAQDAAALLGALEPARPSSAATASARSSRSTWPSAIARSYGQPSSPTRRCSCSCPRRPSASRAQHAALEAAVREGGPEAGVEAWLGGRLDAAALERARAAHRAFFADYAGLASWPVTRRELRALDVPAVVLTGPASPPHVVAAADALAALLPAVRRADDGDLVAAARSVLASP